MSYIVKEIFYSLQGEGTRTGRAAVFCRFAGCNLWSGREMDRSTARCNFCDTIFINDLQRFGDADLLAAAINNNWPRNAHGKPYVICTGGEPLLQLDDALINTLHSYNFEIAVETNGSLPVPQGIDWLCVSPKGGVTLAQNYGDELKLVYPQPNVNPSAFTQLSFHFFFLQPMAGQELAQNTAHAVQYCLAHPQWRLSLQIHKYLQIP